MKKTFEEILADEFNKEENYSITSGDLDDIEVWAKKIMKEIREATIKECIKKGYGLYYENAFDKNPTYINIEEKSLEKLDKNSIEIYEI